MKRQSERGVISPTNLLGADRADQMGTLRHSNKFTMEEDGWRGLQEASHYLDFAVLGLYRAHRKIARIPHSAGDYFHHLGGRQIGGVK